MDKPDVDLIDGLSPAISIDQKTTSRNPRSTVGTVTEIHDYLRLLWARVGTPHCPKCSKAIAQQTIDQIVDSLMQLPAGTRLMILSPVVRARKGEYQKIFDDARNSGYARVRVDGKTYLLDEEIKLTKTKKHTIDIVVDRIAIDAEGRRRLADSVETASNLSGGLVLSVTVDNEKNEVETLYSQKYACVDCNISLEELTPRMFSFNNPYGACPTCTGLGSQLKIDPSLLLDYSLSYNEGAVLASGWQSADNSISSMYFTALAKHFDFSLDTPMGELPENVMDAILYGTKEKLEMFYQRNNGVSKYKQAFEGLVKNLERRYRDTQSEAMRQDIENYMAAVPCPDCSGQRLKPESLAVTVDGMSIAEFSELSVEAALERAKGIKLGKSEMMIAERILKEINERLGFLTSVGLTYLTLSRASGTLSGGESQRIRLATQIGSSLMGVLYILDEPSIGLHQRDNDKLLDTLRRLRDLGNTVMVVEHDDDTVRAADHIIDIGPGAGIHGGQIVASGGLDDIMKCKKSMTGQYLSGKRTIPVPAKRRKGNGKKLTVHGARQNNLKNVTVDIPLGVLTCVTGVSGSGKSSLVNEVLFKRLASELNRARKHAGKHDKITGMEYLNKVIDIDQSPIGRTPRSNPATYTQLFNEIRDLFATTTEAKMRGYGPGRFSFNVKGGRCEACKGDGLLKVEMHFLPDIYVPCEVCKGKRYNRETLEVRYKGKNIYEVLEMTIEEAAAFFENLPRIARRLNVLCEVGLGYVKLGQPATTLSGGEAQRVKLATELAKRSTGATIYILDEPTTGLHTADVHKLVELLQRLVEGGNTVLVIEHNLDVIKSADHVIDLGPEGGDKGGEIVACGTPEAIAKCKKSYTGQYLKGVL